MRLRSFLTIAGAAFVCTLLLAANVQVRAGPWDLGDAVTTAEAAQDFVSFNDVYLYQPVDRVEERAVTPRIVAAKADREVFAGIDRTALAPEGWDFRILHGPWRETERSPGG